MIKNTYVTHFGLERARELAAESYRACKAALDAIGHHTRGDVADLELITDYVYSRTS